MMSKDPGIIRPRNCDPSVRQAIQQLATKVIGLESTPSFVDLTLTGLSASRLLSTNSSKVLSSVSDLASWIAGTANQVIVANDGDGSVTLSTPQDIHTGASPTFAKIILANAPADDRAAPTLAFGDGDTGFYEHAGDDNLALSIGGTLVWTHDANELIGNRGTGTPRLRFLNQAADIPAYTFSDDNNTGMWHPGANTIGFSTNGVECLRIDASKRVTFAGSINRTSGTLTLEIGETPQLSITNTALTLAGNLVMGDGKTMGQAAGPLLTFDDTNNFLEITGCLVGMGTAIPTDRLHLKGASCSLRIENESIASRPAIFLVHTDGDRAGFFYYDKDYSDANLKGNLIIHTDNTGKFLANTFSAFGFGTVTTSAYVSIDQKSASGAMPVLSLDQGDIDDTFVDFIGTSAADGTRSISSDTTEDSAKFGAIRVEINGVTKWIRIYDDES